MCVDVLCGVYVMDDLNPCTATDECFGGVFCETQSLRVLVYLLCIVSLCLMYCVYCVCTEMDGEME